MSSTDIPTADPASSGGISFDASLTAILGILLVMLIVVCVTVLTWHGSITGEAAVTVFMGVVGVSLGGAAVHTGVKAATRTVVASNMSGAGNGSGSDTAGTG